MKMNETETNGRFEVKAEEIQQGIDDILCKLHKRIKKKGRFSFSSTHEMYGILAEEFDELLDEVRSNDIEKFEQEIIDIAVGCIWAKASLYALRRKNIYKNEA